MNRLIIYLLMFVALSSLTYAALSDDILYHWKMDNIPTNAIDIVSGVSLSINGVTNVTGKLGSAGNCDGNDYLDTATLLKLGFNHTISFWAALDVTGSSRYLFDCRVSDDVGYILYSTNNFNYHANTWGAIVTTHADFRLYMIVGNTSGVELFINNVSKGFRTTAIELTGCPIKICVAWNVGGHMIGKIDEWCMWNRTLSRDEVSESYNNGDGISCSEVEVETTPPAISNCICTSCTSGTNNTLDSTPTINCTVTDATGVQAVRIANDTLSFANMGSARNGTAGEGNTWVLTLTSADKLTNLNVPQTLCITANDTLGNAHSTCNVTIDITLVEIDAPNITIIHPTEGAVYFVADVDLNWTYQDVSPLDWCAYSLDGGANDTSICSRSCYQETANVSTSCGGLATGNYSSSGSYFGSQTVDLVYDGDYDTYAQCGSGLCYIYVNYTMPTNALPSSLWQVKDAIGIANLTLPVNCWDENPLQFEIEIINIRSRTNWSCYNGTDWQLLRSSGDGEVAYEEAMWWDLTIPTNITLTSLSDGKHNVTIYANDTFGNMGQSAMINFTVTTDTCTCPGLNQNWEVDMEDVCVINDNCDLGTGKLNHTGAFGNFTCNATISTSDRGIAPADTTFFWGSNCLIEISSS